MGEAHSKLRSVTGRLYFYLEGVSEAEIDLDKVFHRRIEVTILTPDPVIAGLAKESDMGIHRYSSPPPTFPTPRLLDTFVDALLNRLFTPGKRVFMVFLPRR